jgi:pimeloyl-ACP methyl ester carboxylesterase
MRSAYRSPEGRQQILGQYEQILACWPPSYTFHHIDTEFGKTFVVESGNETGNPLILLHGSASNSAMWLGDAIALGQTHRVYAVDIIGEPGKSAETRPELCGGAYACWLQEVMDVLVLDSAAVVGNSLGGWIALDLAVHAPERVNALVLLAPSGLYPYRKSFALKILASRLPGRQGRLNQSVTGSVEIPEAAMAYFALIQREFIPRPLGAPVFSDRELKRLTMPVLYIGGAKDILLNTQKSAARLKRLAPQADTHVLSAAGHTIIGQADVISAFLAAQEV